MSDISSISIGGTEYSIKDNVARSKIDECIPVIYGTQTASTNVWTGVAPFSSLTNNQKIIYFLPYAGTSTAATLNLTLSNNTTTGNIAVYLSATNRITTHYGVGNFIPLVYRSNLTWNGGTTKHTGWWALSDRDTDSNAYLQAWNNKLKAGSVGIFGNTLVMRTGADTYESLVTSRSNTATNKAKNTKGFYLDTILYYNSGTNITSGKYTGTWCVHIASSGIDFRYSSNCGSTLVAYKPVYLVGTIENGLFYLDDTWWTQTLPATESNKVYIYLGDSYSTTTVSVSPTHNIYWYHNGQLSLYNYNSPKQLTTEDLNTIITPGDYYGASSNTCANLPYDVTTFGLHVSISGTTTILQEIFTSNGSYIRTYNTNTSSWHEWKNFTTTGILHNYQGRDKGLLDPDNSVHTSNEVLLGTDYNDLEETGLYNIRGSTTYPTTNGPSELSSTDNLTYVFVMKYSTNYIKQIVFSVRTENIMFVRTKGGGIWRAWSKYDPVTNDSTESGTFTLTAASTDYHQITQISAVYKLINRNFVYINAIFKITAAGTNKKLILSGLPFSRLTDTSSNTMLDIRMGTTSTNSNCYGFDCCIADSNRIYIYARTSGNLNNDTISFAANEKFYISGIYAITGG